MAWKSCVQNFAQYTYAWLEDDTDIYIIEMI